MMGQSLVHHWWMKIPFQRRRRRVGGDPISKAHGDRVGMTKVPRFWQITIGKLGRFCPSLHIHFEGREVGATG